MAKNIIKVDDEPKSKKGTKALDKIKDVIEEHPEIVETVVTAAGALITSSVAKKSATKKKSTTKKSTSTKKTTKKSTSEDVLSTLVSSLLK